MDVKLPSPSPSPCPWTLCRSNRKHLWWSSLALWYRWSVIKERKETLFECQVYLALRHTNWGHCKLKLIQIKFNQMQVFEERGKPEHPGENLSEHLICRESTNSTHIWRRVWESNTGHIGGRRVLSPLRHHCSPRIKRHSQESNEILRIKRDSHFRCW